MATPSLHPDLRQLQAFAMGTLDDGSCDTIGSHLAGCPACQAARGRCGGRFVCGVAP